MMQPAQRNIRNPPHPLHLLPRPPPCRPTRLRHLHLQPSFPPRHHPLRPRLHHPPPPLHLEPFQSPRLPSRPLQPGPLGFRPLDRAAEGGFHTLFLRTQGVRGKECRGDGIGADCGDGGEEVRIRAERGGGVDDAGGFSEETDCLSCWYEKEGRAFVKEGFCLRLKRSIVLRWHMML